MLNKRPDIRCHGEVFLPQQVMLRGEAGRAADLAELKRLRTEDTDQFLDQIYAMNDGCEHTGFKIFHTQSDETLNKIVADPRIAKIVLYRPNRLAQFSSLRARIALQKRSGDREAQSEARKLRFFPEDFLNFLRNTTRFYNGVSDKLIGSGSSWTYVRYDELNDRRAFVRLLSFLGANLQMSKRPLPLRPPNDIVSRFRNPKAVRQFLAENDLMHWAVEGESIMAPLPAARSEDDEPDEG
jgi:hypothetical protein